MANFAKLGSAVFLEDYMISQKGTGYDGLPSTDYKDFNTESFAFGSGNWLVEKPSSITTEIVLISNEKEIKFTSGVDINKGEHLIAVRKNGSYGRQLRFSYTGNPAHANLGIIIKKIPMWLLLLKEQMSLLVRMVIFLI
ncbi:hypothetical protein [Bacteroides faecichinchillae]|uniref:hypothetical protein n=1 Tax=Bacteroides faecichinchillae TaxID=871325 RepID=UPI00046A1F96|nr:hypothetical protein [Bacteroides faecichinchillae]